MSYCSYSDPCPHVLTNLSPSEANVRLCAILQRSPHIQELELHKLRVVDAESARVLSSTLLEMTSLVYLRFKCIGYDLIEEYIYAIFERCPNVEKVELFTSYLYRRIDGVRIAKACPRIHSFLVESQQGCSNGWTYLLAETLKEQQLNAFIVKDGEVLPNDGELVCRALGHHIHTLREIILDRGIPSKALGSILENFENLVTLDLSKSTISLKDAVSVPWASSRFTKLALQIDTGLRRPPYYLRPPPARRSAKEKRIFRQLETLYRRIGELKELRYLQLGSRYTHIDNNNIIPQFPGFLRLQDEEGKAPGFLNLFSELRKLEVVCDGQKVLL
ncbi:hypothetical protein FBU30_007976 [Linnemannia zychae]|nr:hypothetical protein FBU30_007976 [Linnemannia zychae]